MPGEDAVKEGLKADFQRARKPEQKEERRQALLQAAEAMLEEKGDCAGLSLNELAKRAGMAKSNVYRYFESREAVLLALLGEDWLRFFSDVQTRQKGRANVDLFEQLDLLVASLEAHPILCNLMSALPNVLEQNVNTATVLDFKLRSREGLEEAAAFLARQSPQLSPEQWFAVLQNLSVLVTGMWGYTNPSPAVVEALKDERICTFRMDFRKDITNMLSLFARGLLASHPGSD